MFLLALGLVVLILPHLAKRLLPVTYGQLGRAGQVGMGVTSVIGTVLMIIGFRAAEGSFYWGRSPALVGINNLLMLVAVYLFAAHGMKTWIARQIRWPMVWGVILWAAAHLLVNGDTPSFLLFGGIGIWSLLHLALMSATSGAWVRPDPRPARMEWIALAGTLVVYGGIVGVHYALGYPTFG